MLQPAELPFLLLEQICEVTHESAPSWRSQLTKAVLEVLEGSERPLGSEHAWLQRQTPC